MKPIDPSTDVVPLSELRANLAELLKQTQETGRPIVITQHGRGSAVLISADDYSKLLDQLEYARAVTRGAASIAAGKGAPHKEAVASFRQTIAETKSAKSKKSRKARASA
ncbi:MAG: type II toxin-antitoxin system Phd/YefM family antitoxin [Planctomycetes bacterium]|nr:type II toxin-antitoxin system Phd/YefM family antitoxin [Planctomycetota bacterium]